MQPYCCEQTQSCYIYLFVLFCPHGEDVIRIVACISTTTALRLSHRSNGSVLLRPPEPLLQPQNRTWQCFETALLQHQLLWVCSLDLIISHYLVHEKNKLDKCLSCLLTVHTMLQIVSLHVIANPKNQIIFGDVFVCRGWTLDLCMP